MSNRISNIWQSPPKDLAMWIDKCMDSARNHRVKKEALVFFRADDVAVPSKGFTRLMDLFVRYGAPLSLGVVPAWLSEPRWLYLKGFKQRGSDLWCWHQHGWRHQNHVKTGKKQEFGPSRTQVQIKRDLIQGRRRLELHMGKDFFPVFTPPWNRCNLSTLISLKELGYHAVSRSLGSQPSAPVGLPDFQVNVDLHTRKDRASGVGWKGLFEDIKTALGNGFCGIMIHHQRMNEAAFGFLEILLDAFSSRKDLSLVHFGHLVRSRTG